MKDIFAINKPKGPTSHDMVYKVRKITGVKRVGHGGTLDPLASGVLVIAVGREGTRQLEKYVQGEKEYGAVIRLGQTSTTEDEEGEKTKISDRQPTEEEVQNVLKEFIGKINQTPSVYSALKIKGQPAYKYARQGKEMKMEPRKVEITDIKLVSYNYPHLTITITSGKGVYIRSLARDIGEKLATGAYLSDLKRVRVAEFKIGNSLTIEEFEKKWKEDYLSSSA